MDGCLRSQMHSEIASGVTDREGGISANATVEFYDHRSILNPFYLRFSEICHAYLYFAFTFNFLALVVPM